LEKYAESIELRPASLAGRWAEACQPLGSDIAFREVRLDLGCGKGHFTVESARREPDVLFIGIDGEPICIAYAAQKAEESGLDNVIFSPGVADKVTTYFAEGELSRIYLNFPTPFPRKKDAAGRLTHLDNLLRYRKVLADGGSVLLKTDSYPLWGFSKTQFELAGYRVDWESTDARRDRPDDPMSWYEERLSAQGATVFATLATPAREPVRNADGTVGQAASLSLVDYLPEDLSTMDYVPHGMQGTVTNLRNLEKKGHFDRHL
jgi:tRNA (guanine-N7-)-methyltransferase